MTVSMQEYAEASFTHRELTATEKADITDGKTDLYPEDRASDTTAVPQKSL